VGMNMGNFLFPKKKFILFYFISFVGLGPRVMFVVASNIFQSFFSLIKFFILVVVICDLLF